MTIETLLICIVGLLAGIFFLNIARLGLAIRQQFKIAGLEVSQTAQRDAWIDMCNGLRDVFAEQEGEA